MPEDGAELRRHTKDTNAEGKPHNSWTRCWAPGQRQADQHPQTRVGPPSPTVTPHTLTHAHTRTETHIHADKHSSTEEPAALTLSPEPLTWASTVPLGWSSPLPRGGQQAGVGEEAPESQAKLPLIRAGRGGAPTSERGLPGGGHLRTSPPTHAAVWAPSPASPAPPSFRQLRLASPHPPPLWQRLGRGHGGGGLPG